MLTHRQTFLLSLILFWSTAACSMAVAQNRAPRTSNFGGIEMIAHDQTVAPSDERKMKRGGDAPAVMTWDASIAGIGKDVGGATVRTFASNNDTLFVAGDFYSFDTSYAAGSIIQYDAISNQWTALGEAANNEILTCAYHKGKLYIGGYFQTMGSQRNIVNYVAVWDGISWQPLGTGLNGYVYSMACVGDDLYVGGEFTLAGATSVSNIARWDGTDWFDVNGGTSRAVTALYATHDSLFVGGLFAGAGHVRTNHLALLRNGIWTPLGLGVDGNVNAMTMFQGKLWIGGDFFWSHDESETYYCLITWDGSVQTAFRKDSVFGTNGTGMINTLLASGDSVIIGGSFTALLGVPTRGLAVWKSGAFHELAPVFGTVSALTMFHNQLYVGGEYSKIGSVYRDNLAASTPTGWTEFGTGPRQGYQSERVRTIATTDQYVCIGGDFSKIDNVIMNHIALYDKKAKVWQAVGGGVDGAVNQVSFQGNVLYVGGEFNFAGQTEAHRLAKYDLVTRTWSAMSIRPSRYISSFALDGSNLYASVYFAAKAGGTVNNIGKWDGTTWTPLPGDINGYVYSLNFFHSNLVAAGYIYSIDGNLANNIAMFDGSAWNPFDAGTNNPVFTTQTFQNKLYITGAFDSASGMPASNIAYWDGSLWQPLGGGLNSYGHSLVPSGNVLYVGGDFSTAGNVAAAHLAVWNGSAFRSVANGTNDGILAMAIDHTALYAGGWFNRVNGDQIYSNRFGALLGAGLGVNERPASAGSYNYPNPLRAATNFTTLIPYTTDAAGGAQLHIVDERGVEILSQSIFVPSAGQHSLTFDANLLATGRYRYQLDFPAGHTIAAHSMVIVR